MKEKISVIVPIYNVEMFLPKCIDSIITQTYKNIEIILVNDGSTDGSGNICDEYANKYDNITVVHKKNGGLSSARNAGIEIACGDYLAFIDSDDYIAPEMLELLYATILNDNSDMAICGYICVNEKGEEVSPGKNVSDEVLTREKAYEKLCEHNNTGYIIACNKLYKKKIFNDIRYPLGKMHEDEFVIHHVFNKCDKISCIQKVLYFYLQRQGSIMKKNNIKNLDGTEAVLDRTEYFIKIGMSSDKVYVSLKKALNSIKRTYKSRDYLSRKYKKQYELLYKRCNSIIAGLLKCNLSFRKKAFLIMNYLSPFCTYLFERVAYKLMKKK